jgi:hypothetical protein
MKNNFVIGTPPAAVSSLYCSAERHLWKGGGIPLAIYGKLYALSADNQGKVFCKIQSLTDFLGCSYDAAWISFKKLVVNGWLERTDTPPSTIYQMRASEFDGKTYRIISHKEWAERHPGACVEVLQMPWSSETADPLARRLYAASDGKTKWYRNMLAGLRKTGLSDDQILEEWRSFLAGWRAQGKRPSRAACFQFMRELREEFKQETAPAATFA